MSDVMFYGVLCMPYEMAMSDELSRRQFYSRAQESADRVKALEAELAALRAAPAEPLGALPPLPSDDELRTIWRTANKEGSAAWSKAECDTTRHVWQMRKVYEAIARQAIAADRAQQAAAGQRIHNSPDVCIPHGWMLVPTRITNRMKHAAQPFVCKFRVEAVRYRALLSAAPPPPPGFVYANIPLELKHEQLKPATSSEH